MNILFTVYVFILFFVLTPGILITLPRKSSKMIVSLVHGLIFASILTLSGHYVWKLSNSIFEGAQPKTPDELSVKLKKVKDIINKMDNKNLDKEKKIAKNMIDVIIKEQNEAVAVAKSVGDAVDKNMTNLATAAKDFDPKAVNQQLKQQSDIKF